MLRYDLDKVDRIQELVQSGNVYLMRADAPGNPTSIHVKPAAEELLTGMGIKVSRLLHGRDPLVNKASLEEAIGAEWGVTMALAGAEVVPFERKRAPFKKKAQASASGLSGSGIA